MTLESLLNDPSWTPYALSSIDVYQIEGETLTWNFNDYSIHSIPGYFDQVSTTIQAIDDIIDVDFTYTENNTEADLWVNLRNRSITSDYILGTFTNNILWGTIDIYHSDYETYQSNWNTFTHELGHYLGLGEPGFDSRFDQSDTVMSYNSDPGIVGGFNTFFQPNDLDVLLSLHGAENDYLPQFSQSVRSFLGDNVDVLKGQSNINIGMLGGDDILEVVGGTNNFANGNRGSDHIILRGGLGHYLGGSENDRLDVFDAEAGSWINGNKGEDTVTGSIEGVTYRGGSENDLLSVSAGNVWGDKGSDIFQAVGGSGVAIVEDYEPGLDFVQRVSGGIFSSADGGISYGVGGDQMLLLLGISDSSQVSVI
jgi:hypothetical protein